MRSLRVGEDGSVGMSIGVTEENASLQTGRFAPDVESLIQHQSISFGPTTDGGAHAVLIGNATKQPAIGFPVLECIPEPAIRRSLCEAALHWFRESS